MTKTNLLLPAAGKCRTEYQNVSAPRREQQVSLTKPVRWIVLLFLFYSPLTRAQFSPVPVTGFNQDVVAETGTSSLTTTTMALDAVPASNRVMYTNTFRISNGFGGGGLPDNGLITSGADSYQLADYAASNALLLQRTQTGDLGLVTPDKFSRIRVLAFTTEGTSLVNIVLTFTDGTTSIAATNYALSDWFNATANLVISGFGRCARSTPAGSADGYPTNPRMYYIDIPLSCADRARNLAKISFTNVTTGGSNAPYPNAVFMAVSGLVSNPAISSSITDATCTVNGSVTLSISGVLAPYTVTWNTTPVQTGVTATNLTPGNYQATITDATGCTIYYPVTIGLLNNLFLTTHIDTFVCAGSSFSSNTNSNALNFSWSPTTGVSDPLIMNPVLTPTGNVTYTVTGTTGNCVISKSFNVFFLAKAIADFDVTVKPCSNDPVLFTDRSSVTGGAPNQWHWTENGVLISTQQNPQLPFSEGPHRVGLIVNGTVGCTSDTTFKTFTVTGKPLIDLLFSDACKGSLVDFTAKELNSTGVNNWFWLFLDDGSTASGASTLHRFNSSGSIAVKLAASSAAGCLSDTITRFINIYSTQAYAGRDTVTASGIPVQLQGSGGTSYSWTPAQYLNNPNMANPMATIYRDQQFILKAYTPLGCESYDTVLVKVSEVADIYLPGAFSPGGTNILYHALPVGIREFRYLRIYNRYGQQVFNTTDYRKGWDGALTGKQQNSGVYVAMAAGVDYHGVLVERQTSFLLIR